MLADDLRRVAAFAVARHLDAQRAIIGDQRLTADAVTLVQLTARLEAPRPRKSGQSTRVPDVGMESLVNPLHQM